MVASTFSQYHCFLFPTQSENYGHVISEALSVSCPVVLSRGTTPWDDIDRKAGYVCRPNDIDDFAAKLELLGMMNQADYDTLQKSTRDYFNNKITCDDAIQGHINMLKRITYGQ